MFNDSIVAIIKVGAVNSVVNNCGDTITVPSRELEYITTQQAWESFTKFSYVVHIKNNQTGIVIDTNTESKTLSVKFNSGIVISNYDYNLFVKNFNIFVPTVNDIVTVDHTKTFLESKYKNKPFKVDKCIDAELSVIVSEDQFYIIVKNIALKRSNLAFTSVEIHDQLKKLLGKRETLADKILKEVSVMDKTSSSNKVNNFLSDVNMDLKLQNVSRFLTEQKYDKAININIEKYINYLNYIDKDLNSYLNCLKNSTQKNLYKSLTVPVFSLLKDKLSKDYFNTVFSIALDCNNEFLIKDALKYDSNYVNSYLYNFYEYGKEINTDLIEPYRSIIDYDQVISGELTESKLRFISSVGVDFTNKTMVNKLLKGLSAKNAKYIFDYIKSIANKVVWDYDSLLALGTGSYTRINFIQRAYNLDLSSYTKDGLNLLEGLQQMKLTSSIQGTIGFLRGCGLSSNRDDNGGE